jgi:hypothetical protein
VHTDSPSARENPSSRAPLRVTTSGRLGHTCRDALVRTAWAEVLAPLGEQLLAS